MILIKRLIKIELLIAKVYKGAKSVTILHVVSVRSYKNTQNNSKKQENPVIYLCKKDNLRLNATHLITKPHPLNISQILNKSLRLFDLSFIFAVTNQITTVQ